MLNFHKIFLFMSLFSRLIWFISAFMCFCTYILFSASLWFLPFSPSRCCRWFWAMMRNVNCCFLLFSLGKVCPKKWWNTMRSTALISNGKVGSRTALLTQQQLCSRRAVGWFYCNLMNLSSADLDDGADNRQCADTKTAADLSHRISELGVTVLRKGVSLSHT